MDIQLPVELAATLGPILAVDTPVQGSAFEVVVVTTRRGRVVIKRGTTPATRAELAEESRVLHVLREERPFVAVPVDVVPGADTDTFAFTYLEGEPMSAALQAADEAKKHALVARFGATLRRIHAWTPPLPRVDDWLPTVIARERVRIDAMPRGAIIRGTHTRFDGLDARRLVHDVQTWASHVTTDLVFGHGDYCLPNVLVREDAVVGIIDWSRGGYADRRFDLATGLFSLRVNDTLGAAAYLTTFLQGYGCEESVETLHMFEALHALTCFW